MTTVLFGVLLLITIIVLIYMASRSYENVDPIYWSLFILFPVILLGYWFKTQVTTVEGAMLSFSILYIDSTVLLVLILFLLMHFLNIPVWTWLKVTAYSLAFGHLIMIWLCFKNQLYYKTITLTFTPNGTVTRMTSGPLKVFHWIFLALILVSIIGLVVVAFIRKGTYSRRSLAMCSGLISAGLLIYSLETLLDVDFSMLPFLYVVTDILIAWNYDHAHMHDITGLISKEKEDSGRAYAALDRERRFLSCSEGMFHYLPELADQIVDARLKEGTRPAMVFNSLIDQFLRDGRNVSDVFEIDDRKCQLEVIYFSLRRKGKPQGYLIDVRDVTEEQALTEALRDRNMIIEKEVDEKTRNIRHIQNQIVLGLANMIENRDSDSGGHVRRTSSIIGYVVASARRLGVYQIDDIMAQDIIRAAPMHDLGKITIDSSILQKQDALTGTEYAIMKTHAQKSGEFVDILLRDVEEEHFVRVAHNIARYHHERWDGEGYPEGLKGEEIPVEARIMAIADVYDALVSVRCYKERFSFPSAASIMLDGMGSHFDPRLRNVFLDCREQLEDYYRENPESPALPPQEAGGVTHGAG